MKQEAKKKKRKEKNQRKGEREREGKTIVALCHDFKKLTIFVSPSLKRYGRRRKRKKRERYVWLGGREGIPCAYRQIRKIDRAFVFTIDTSLFSKLQEQEL